MVSRATFCSILKLSLHLIRRYIVLCFLPKNPVLLPTNDKIKGLIGSQNGASIHLLVSPGPRDQSVYIGGRFYLISSSRGIPALERWTLVRGKYREKIVCAFIFWPQKRGGHWRGGPYIGGPLYLQSVSHGNRLQPH